MQKADAIPDILLWSMYRVQYTVNGMAPHIKGLREEETFRGYGEDLISRSLHVICIKWENISDFNG